MHNRDIDKLLERSTTEANTRAETLRSSRAN
jgi:hypothetical protein